MTNEPPVVLQSRNVLPISGKEVVIVSINRPTQLNCFNIDVCQALATIFKSLRDDTDDLAAIILTGEGTSFCAGADLSDPPSPIIMSSDLPHHLEVNPVHQMSLIQVPIIGALKGYVITGGFELALACDILVGDASVVFRDTHCKFNLAPCWGLSQKLQRRIGSGRAKIMSLGAVPVKASQAHAWGLLDEIVLDSSKLSSSLERSLEIADYIGKNASQMVVRYRNAMDQGGSVTLEEGLKRERALGLAHYIEALGDGSTFSDAKEFITDEKRSRSRL